MVYLTSAGFLAYFDFMNNGILSLLIDVVFFALGVLLVNLWHKKEKTKSEDSSEVL